MRELVMILAEGDREALGPVRCLPGLQAAADASGIWLRGIPIAGAAMSIKQLPAIHTYVADEANRLFPVGKLTPVGELPLLTWQPLQRFIPVALPVSALPGKLQQRYRPDLIAQTGTRNASALLTSLAHWKQYVEFAPLVRLRRLQFALSDKNEVLIIGELLAPIPGREFWLQDDLLLPAGFNFDPPLAASLAAEALNPSKDGLLLFQEDGSCQKILLTSIVPASRSAVRLIQKGGKDG